MKKEYMVANGTFDTITLTLRNRKNGKVKIKTYKGENEPVIQKVNLYWFQVIDRATEDMFIQSQIGRIIKEKYYKINSRTAKKYELIDYDYTIRHHNYYINKMSWEQCIRTFTFQQLKDMNMIVERNNL